MANCIINIYAEGYIQPVLLCQNLAIASDIAAVASDQTFNVF